MKKNSLLVVDESLVDAEEMPYIYVSKFTEDSASDFFKQFNKLESDPKVQVIPIVVNSFGGQVHTLLAMLDIINSSTKPVATIGIGKAMSCGAFLLAAGHKGYRFAAPSTDIMIHEVSSMEWGKTTEIENGAKQTKKLNDNLFKQLAAKAGKKDKNYFLKALKARTNVDWYLTSSEAKKVGMVDHVILPKFLKKSYK